MAIGEICSREVVFIARSESCAQAARLMRENHVGSLVVQAVSLRGELPDHAGSSLRIYEEKGPLPHAGSGPGGDPRKAPFDFLPV